MTDDYASLFAGAVIGRGRVSYAAVCGGETDAPQIGDLEIVLSEEVGNLL